VRAALRVVRATVEELAAHERTLAAIDKASGGKTIWKQLPLAVGA
jgi:DNA polymerase-3 subunit epsilon